MTPFRLATVTHSKLLPHTFFTFYREKSREIEEDLNEKVDAYHKVLDSFADEKKGIKEQKIWTKKEMAAKLGAGG